MVNLIRKKGFLVVALLLIGLVALTGCRDQSAELNKDENILGNAYFNSGDIYLVNDLEEADGGNFDTQDSWLFLENDGKGTAKLDNGMAKLNISNGGGNSYSVQLIQAPLTIEKGYKYKFRFDAKASKTRDLEVKIGATGGRGWRAYSSGDGNSGGVVKEISKELKTYEFEFVMGEKTDNMARLELQLGLDDGTIWLDNVELIKLGQAEKAEIPEEPKKEWVYDDDFFFIFNVAVGGHWPGYPDQTTEFPTNMEVDYIRVYDQAGDLEWSDEFEGQEINEEYWTFEVGNGHQQGIPGWGNAEKQYYTDGDNAEIIDGKLVITAREEEKYSEAADETFNYTSTRMITRAKVNMKYGRVEVRAKLPDGGQGIWPAIWMLGEDISEVGWPQCGEIDIMEFLGQQKNVIHGTIHGPQHSGGGGIGSSYVLPEGNFSDDFNTFIFEWEEDEMRWYVNDEKEAFHVIRKTSDGEVEEVEIGE